MAVMSSNMFFFSVKPRSGTTSALVNVSKSSERAKLPDSPLALYILIYPNVSVKNKEGSGRLLRRGFTSGAFVQEPGRAASISRSRLSSAAREVARLGAFQQRWLELR